MRRSYRRRQNHRRAAMSWECYSKVQLVALAKTRGIRANSRWGRDTIIGKLEAL